MEDVSRVPEQRFARLERADIAPLEREVAIAFVVGEVGLAPPNQIVDDAHHHAALEQQIVHVAADEAGATGDDSNRPLGHAACNAFSLRTLK